MDTVFIEGLQIEALIGIYDWERRIRQPLVFDLEMQFDNRIPAATDAIADTLDYKAVSKRLVEYVGQSQFGLVETLAERVAAIVLDEFGVERVRLKLSKPGAVRGARAVGVMIERTREAGARKPRPVDAAQAAPPVPAAAAAMPAVFEGSADGVEAHAVEAHEADAHEADVHEADAHEADAHDADAHEADVHEADVHEADADEVAAPDTDADAVIAADDPAVAAADALVAEYRAMASTVARESAAMPAAHTDEAAGPSPLEAALLAAVSGWHAPRPATAAIESEAADDAAGGQGPIEVEVDPAEVDGAGGDTVAVGALDATQVDEAGASRIDGIASETTTTASLVAPETAGPTTHETPSADDEARAVAAAGAPVDDAATQTAADVAPPPLSDPAPDAPAPAPRANFMRDLDEAPVRPVSVPAADDLGVGATEAPSDAHAAVAAEPSTAADARASGDGREDANAAAAPVPAATPASPPVVPAFRTAPPPPPRPRNPASDLGRTTRPAYLSLGSNIEPEKNLRSALMALRARFGEVIVSPVYRMTAVGFEGPEFLNAAAIIDSDLDPFALTRWLHGIESAHGRIRSHVKNSSRTLDMDIIFFDDLVLDMPGGLQLPRPELRHAFVLKPLVDIAPGFVDPVRGVHLADVWAAHSERDQRFSTVII